MQLAKNEEIWYATTKKAVGLFWGADVTTQFTTDTNKQLISRIEVEWKLHVKHSNYKGDDVNNNLFFVGCSSLPF